MPRGEWQCCIRNNVSMAVVSVPCQSADAYPMAYMAPTMATIMATVAI